MPIRKTRNLSLAPELETLVDRKLTTRRYSGADEVVRAVPCLPDEQKHRLDEPSSSMQVVTDAGR